MPWVPWIAIENDDTSNHEAHELYRQTRTPAGGVSDLIRVTSRRPAVSLLIHRLVREVYGSARGLTLREKEIAALVTSTFIGCVH